MNAQGDPAVERRETSGGNPLHWRKPGRPLLAVLTLLLVFTGNAPVAVAVVGLAYVLFRDRENP